jgi:alcohol dehydrogenase
MFYGVIEPLSDLAPYHAGDIPPHSSVDVVSRIARAAEEVKADCLVAIGGGSVSDTAKGVALSLAEGEPIERHATRRVESGSYVTPTLSNPKLPILSIPTTAAGAEMTPAFAVMSLDGAKLLFWDARVVSRVVLLDSTANLSVPAGLMLATGMNGLAHCVEALYSKRRSPISSILAAHGIALFLEALEQVALAPHDEGARSRLLVAANIGGTVLGTTGSCLHHAICHVLGAMTRLPHGDLNSVILPHAVDFNAPYAMAELKPLCTESDDPAALVRALQRRVGVPTRLRDLGFPRELLESAAEKVMHERGLANNPRPIESQSDVHALLLQAW